jgi:hypothetical protein
MLAFFFKGKQQAQNISKNPSRAQRDRRKKNVESILSRKHTKSMKHVKCFLVPAFLAEDGFCAAP